jgi:amidase
VRSRKLSSTELVEAHLARIEAVNPRLNAVVLVTAEAALEEARAADTALARGEIAGPLHGVPMTVKDALETAGVVCTGGTVGRADFVPQSDAITVARMRAAGAILLGKTNLPEFSIAYESDNALFGRTNNPYDVTRTAGGSTGGEAAIIAACGSPMGLGSDAGGSVRVPSHCCGTAGIKPTSGRVPRTGHWPKFNGLLDAYTQIGPMARYVEDLVLMLPILAGVDWQDPAIVPMPLYDPANLPLDALKVAFYTDDGVVSPTPETIATVESAAKALDEAGCSISGMLPAGVEKSCDMLTGMWGAILEHGEQDLLDAGGTPELSPLIASSKRILLKGASARDLLHLAVEQDEFRSTMLRSMEPFDAIVCPVNAYPALPHGKTFDHIDAFSYTQTYNLTGWPGAVVRGGTSPEGLPIGVQIVAKPWREDVALALAGIIEAALGGWRAPPM